MLSASYYSQRVANAALQLSAFALACPFLRPSRWWRSTPSSEMTSLCLTPSGWRRTTALRRRKKVSLRRLRGSTFPFSVSLLGILHVPVKNVRSIKVHSTCLHMEAMKSGQLWMQRFSVFTVKHDPLCWSRAAQSRAAC